MFIFIFITYICHEQGLNSLLCPPAPGSQIENAGPSGEQQLCRGQHQHRARGLGVVRGARLLLGGPAGTLREEQGGLPPRLLVAQHGGPQGMKNIYIFSTFGIRIHTIKNRGKRLYGQTKNSPS